MRFSLLVAAATVLLTGCLADIRPDAKFEPCPSHVARGRALLERMAFVHGGDDAAGKTLSATFTNDWPGLMAFGRPWPGDVTTLRIDTAVGTSEGSVTFLDGADANNSWTLRDGQGTPDDNARFWVATIGYFLQAPLRLHEATTVYFQGQEEVDGTAYDVVFASWGGAKPQDDVDQYLVWLDAESHQLAHIDFTVRDMGGFITGGMDYRDYVAHDGMLLPKLVIGTSKPGGDQGGHAIRIQQWHAAAATSLAHR